MRKDISSDGLRSGAVNGKSAKKQAKPSQDTGIKYTEKSIDLKNDPACFLGKSQVTSKKAVTGDFKAETVKNITNDLNILKNNPKLVKKSDKAFDIAFQGMTGKNIANAYEKAANMQVAFVQEFQK